MTGKIYPSVLLLEDQALIALDTEFHLSKAGFRIAGTLSSCAEAMEWLINGVADAAVLDIVLGDGISVRVAEVLAQLRIPFLVYSGDSFDKSILPKVFGDVVWISKPCEPAEMIAAVVALTARTREATVPGGSQAAASSHNAPPPCTDDVTREIKRRVQLTKEQKRDRMEEATRFAFEDTEKRRALNSQKTARLRALRLAASDQDCEASPR